MSLFQAKILTPKELKLDCLVKSVLVETVNGKIEILAKHQNLLTQVALGFCEVIDQEDEKKVFLIDNALVKIVDNVTTIVAINCELMKEAKLFQDYQLTFQERLEKIKFLIKEALANEAYFTSSNEHIYAFETEKLAKFELLNEITKGKS